MKPNKVFVSASWIIGCKIAQSGLALMVNILTARYFGPSNFGLINYAASLVVFITPLMTLGTDAILVNEIIKNPESEGTVLGTSMTITFFSSLVCIAGLYGFVKIANTEDPVVSRVVLLYSLLLISQSVEQIQYWFHAKYLSKIVSLVSLCAYIVISFYKILLLVHGKSIYWFAISNSLDYLFIAVGLFIIYKKKYAQRLKFSLSVAKSLWNTSKHYILPGLMEGIIIQSDRIMIRHICGDVELGFYSAALSISTLTNFIFAAIITAYRPAILEAKKMSIHKFETSMGQLYGIISYFALLQSFILTALASFFVNIMFGQEYLQAIPMLQIVVWYTFFSYIGGVRSVWTLAENKQEYLWIINLSGMGLNLLLNFILIPRFQGKGAAVATVITQAFTNIILVYLIKPLRINIIYMIKGLLIRK